MNETKQILVISGAFAPSFSTLNRMVSENGKSNHCRNLSVNNDCMRSICSIAFFTFIFFACKNDDGKGEAVATRSVDSGYLADSASLAAVIDSLHSAFKANSIDSMNKYFAEDGLFIGTDPNEFWTREGLNNYLKPGFETATAPSAYTVSKRAITMSTDRKSGVVIDQYALPFSPKLPVRSVAFAELTGNKWTIKMFSWSFVANNDDVNKLNDALK